MAAQRSRTTGWRCYLQQLIDRKGSLQIAIAHNESTGRDFVWRAKLIKCTEDEIHVETPTTSGEPIPLMEGVQLLGIMAIGQNRWMFRTFCLGTLTAESDHGKCGLRLKMPDSVERCQRRRNYRISTDQLDLPEVKVWPLLDPKTVVLPEQLCQRRLELHIEGVTESYTSFEKTALPNVGAPFSATLVNIGGGGLGLQVAACDAKGIHRHRLFWLCFPLLDVNAPSLCLTSKLVHQRLESGGTTYMGLMFDFTFNPSHRQFVIKQITYAVAIQQRKQFLAA